MIANGIAWTKKVCNRAKNVWWDFQTGERYWKIRNTIQVWDFYVRRSYFNERRRFEGTQSVIGDLLTISKGTLPSLFWAVLLFVVLTGGNSLLAHWFPEFQNALADLTDKGLSLFNSSLDSRIDVYASFFGGVASVSGVFLGLYFTSVSIGVGQQIGNLSPRVRHLVITERKGTLYIKLLSVLAALSFLLWANASAFGNISYPGIIFVTVFVLMLIAAFYSLGLNSFYMSDPTSIAFPIFTSINSTLRKLKSRSKFSAHPAFDAHYREQVSSDLKILREVVAMALTAPRRDREQMGNLIFNLSSQILFYLNFKHSIQSQSQWYRRIYRHDDWLLVDEFKGKLLEHIGTSQPTEEPNPDWLEQEALELIEVILRDYELRKDAEGMTYLLSVLRRFISSLAARWEIDYALRVHEAVRKYTRSLYQDSSVPFRSRVYITETASILQIDIIQQCLQRVLGDAPTTDVEKLTDIVLKNNRIPEGTLPKISLLIENLSSQLDLERRVEGKNRTPRWYVSQLIAKAFNDQIASLYSKLTKIPEPPGSGKTTTFENAAVEIMVIQRDIEVISRLKNHFDHYAKFSAHLKSFEKISDFPIKSFGVENVPKAFEEKLDQYFDCLGDLLIPSFSAQRDKEFPDFFGMTYYRLANELYRQLHENEPTRFGRLYPKVLMSAFLARQRLMEEYGHLQDVVTKARISFDPIYDMMAIGGYAALFSELHGTPALIDIVLRSWKAILSELKIETDKLDWLASIYLITQHDLRFSGRDASRFEWHQGLMDVLREKGFVIERFLSMGPDGVQPQTKYLKVLCRDGYEPHEDIREIFLVIFLPLLGANEKTMESLNSQFYRNIRRSEMKLKQGQEKAEKDDE